MNIKLEKEKEFLKLKKIIRELRMIRYNHLGTPRAGEITKAIEILEPIVQELDDWITNATKPVGDYDI
tara:strand:+ start:173 stop:376 length:204 start_codon:yes stop_codon:yes gene_type:complete